MNEEPIKVERLEDVIRLVRECRIVVVPWDLMPGGECFPWERTISHSLSNLGIRTNVAHALYARASVVCDSALESDPAFLVSVACPPAAGERPRLLRRHWGRRFLDLLGLTGSAAMDLSGFPPAQFGRQDRPR